MVRYRGRPGPTSVNTARNVSLHCSRPQISLILGHGHFGLDNILFLGALRPCVGAQRPNQDLEQGHTEDNSQWEK